MIAISIVAIAMAIGIPSFVHALKKEDLRKAVSDVVEGCSHARAQAIFKGVPMEFVIRADGGNLSVEPVKMHSMTSESGASPEYQQPSHGSSTPAPFASQLPTDVAVTLLYVNFQDLMEAPEARVRFYPNGTSDEFTVILFSEKGEKKISVDVVTGLTEVEVLR
jgi:Tfp pilus assembly protein FimT